MNAMQNKKLVHVLYLNLCLRRSPVSPSAVSTFSTFASETDESDTFVAVPKVVVPPRCEFGALVEGACVGIFEGAK
jgi:hypothetical protein